MNDQIINKDVLKREQEELMQNPLNIGIKYHIDADIVAQTNCLRNFSCLYGKGDCLCNVSSYLRNNDGLVLIDPVDDADCSYIWLFGFSGWVCSCPTRVAIYRQYGR